MQRLVNIGPYFFQKFKKMKEKQTEVFKNFPKNYVIGSLYIKNFWLIGAINFLNCILPFNSKEFCFGFI